MKLTPLRGYKNTKTDSFKDVYSTVKAKRTNLNSSGKSPDYFDNKTFQEL